MSLPLSPRLTSQMPKGEGYNRRMLLSRRVVLVFAAIQVLSLVLAAADLYPPPANAASDLQRARERASRSAKLLMVVFGGNWCADCRALHARLHESPVREYVADHFEIVNVNIGEKNATRGSAKEGGVPQKGGAPAAVFSPPEEKPVGFTNQGELDPARQYNARQ